jgi:GNAT superfamily N-acetyltransferase
LSEGAGWNQLRRDWRVFLERNPEGSVAAQEGGRVVGTAATLDYGPFAWISMVLVDPEERGRGLGTALLEWTLEILRDSPARGWMRRRWASRCTASWGSWMSTQWSAGSGRPGEAPEAAGRPRRWRSVEEVAALDAEVFGADRRWLLDWLLCGIAARWRGGAGDGFLLGREGRRFTQLGPLICANDDEAVALIHAGLAGVGARRGDRCAGGEGGAGGVDRLPEGSGRCCGCAGAGRRRFG